MVRNHIQHCDQVSQSAPGVISTSYSLSFLSFSCTLSFPPLVFALIFSAMLPFSSVPPPSLHLHLHQPVHQSSFKSPFFGNNNHFSEPRCSGSSFTRLYELHLIITNLALRHALLIFLSYIFCPPFHLTNHYQSS